MTLSETTKLVAEWQTRLRLLDWDIEIRVIDNHESYGSIAGELKYKYATIKLCSESTINRDWGGCQDYEVIIVHELLHLHGKGFDHKIKDGSQEDIAYETMVDLTAQALVAAKRGVQRLGDTPL